MFYEEKYDNGVWYWRGTPDGAWIEMGKRQLSEKLAAAQREIAAWQKTVDDYNDPRVQHIAAAWWIKNRVAELLAQEVGK